MQRYQYTVKHFANIRPFATWMVFERLLEFDESHGRFIFASNHTRHQKRTHTLPESDAAIILLVSPNEKKIATNIRKTVEKADWQVLPNETPIITIETDFDDPLATIDLHIKASVFLADLAENHHDINPFSPPNYGGVRKEFPMGGLKW